MRTRVGRAVGVAALGLALATTGPASATHESRAFGGFDADESREIEELVREYLLNHPEVILEAVDRLRQRQQREEEQRRRQAASAVRPVDGDDHVLGDPAAPVKVIEFSDFECPFCKRFHVTMKRLMDDYGGDGRVAWVYRHFPIDSIHSKARKEAQAAECAAELGGNDGFWEYADRLFDATPSNDRLDLTLLPRIAQEIGLDRAKFEDCLAGDSRGGKFADHIETDYQDARAAGATGTPYTVVVGKNGQTFPLTGAQPYAALRSIVDLALKGE